MRVKGKEDFIKKYWPKLRKVSCGSKITGVQRCLTCQSGRTASLFMDVWIRAKSKQSGIRLQKNHSVVQHNRNLLYNRFKHCSGTYFLILFPSPFPLGSDTALVPNSNVFRDFSTVLLNKDNL
jgi:hypothetical protein